MTHSALTPLLGREFDDFLFASIGEDRNGTTLSVLSALARFDVDPWQETASLARMPKERATERLAALIAATPMDSATGLSAATIAARLIALLPRHSASEISALRTVVDARDVRKFRAGMCMYAIFFIIVMAAQWIAASLQAPPRIDNTEASASSTVLPQPPSSNSGQ